MFSCPIELIYRQHRRKTVSSVSLMTCVLRSVNKRIHEQIHVRGDAKNIVNEQTEREKTTNRNEYVKL